MLPQSLTMSITPLMRTILLLIINRDFKPMNLGKSAWPTCLLRIKSHQSRVRMNLKAYLAFKRSYRNIILILKGGQSAPWVSHASTRPRPNRRSRLLTVWLKWIVLEWITSPSRAWHSRKTSHIGHSRLSTLQRISRRDKLNPLTQTIKVVSGSLNTF